MPLEPLGQPHLCAQPHLHLAALASPVRRDRRDEAFPLFSDHW